MNGYKPTELGVTGVIKGAEMVPLSTFSGAASGTTSIKSSSSPSIPAKVVSAATTAAKGLTDLLSSTFDAAKRAAKQLATSGLVNSVIGLIKGDLASNPLVKKGSKGAAVVELQQSLNAVANAGLKPDGIFGPKTESAVKIFQSSKGLTVDGIVGPKTWRALQNALTKPVAEATPTQVSPIAQSAHRDEVIAFGDKNAQVASFQMGINNMNYSSTGAKPLAVDGIFGNATSAAVPWAQKSLGLPVTGKVDTATYKSVIAVKPSGTAKQPVKPSAETIIASANPIVGSISEDVATTLIQADSRVLSKSRYASAARARSDSALLLEAVLAQLKPLITKKVFTFFDQLNAYLLPLTEALAWHETQIDNAAIGQAKEVSIFQLLPKTAASLQKLYNLPDLNINNAASLSGYMIAMFKDMDSFASKFIKKDISGAMISGTPGNDHITAVLSQLNTAPALMTQLFAFFMLYNAGLAESTWREGWRAAEAYKRTLSVLVTAGGY